MDTSVFRYSFARFFSGVFALFVYTAIYSVLSGSKFTDLGPGVKALLPMVFLAAGVPLSILILFSIFIDAFVVRINKKVLKVIIEIVLYGLFGYLSGVIWFLSYNNNIFILVSGQIVSLLYYLFLKIVYRLDNWLMNK